MHTRRCGQSSVFELDEFGYAHTVNDGEVPPELEEKARLAIQNCPENAITVLEE